MLFDRTTNVSIENSPQLDANSDQALLQACQHGESAAWEQLLKKYERLVFSVARNCGLSADDAADVTQITFTYLMQSLSAVNAQQIGGWLATVARRHSWRLLKQGQRTGNDELDLDLLEGLLPDPTASHDLERWELAEWIEQGLSQLGERCQQLLIALYFDQQEPSYKAIAETVGIPEGSIGPTRARCLKQLREVLEEKTKNKSNDPALP